MKLVKSFASVVLALVGVIFLIPAVKQAINGEPLSFSPSLATAVGFFLGAVVAFMVRRTSGRHSDPPSA